MLHSRKVARRAPRDSHRQKHFDAQKKVAAPQRREGASLRSLHNPLQPAAGHCAAPRCAFFFVPPMQLAAVRISRLEMPHKFPPTSANYTVTAEAVVYTPPQPTQRRKKSCKCATLVVVAVQGLLVESESYNPGYRFLESSLQRRQGSGHFRLVTF